MDLAKLANDEMAELIHKYRDRFVAAIALLPMNNIDAAMKETDRAIKDLGFKGIYVHSNINGKPLDSEEFLPLYEKMAHYNLPDLHPSLEGRQFRRLPDRGQVEVHRLRAYSAGPTRRRRP